MVKKTAIVQRKTFVAREDLLNRLVEIAKERGCSLYELVNELFELAITSQDLGMSLKMVVDSRKRLEGARNLGFVLSLESLLYEMSDLAYQKAKSKALKSWFDAGVWFATRYTAGNNETPLKSFKEDLIALTWNAPEFLIDISGENLSVAVTSPRFTESYTDMLSSFVEGALKVFGYQIKEREISSGVIRLRASKGVLNGSA